MEAKFSAQHDEAEIAADITLNYERMLESRERGENVLELTFEQRMNAALDRYAGIIKTAGRAALVKTEMDSPHGSPETA